MTAVEEVDKARGHTLITRYFFESMEGRLDLSCGAWGRATARRQRDTAVGLELPCHGVTP
jgi:hypothetical protein